MAAILTWNANNEPDLAGYKVYRGLNGAALTLLTSLGKVTTYTDSALPINADFTVAYALSAFDTSNNESARSATVSVSVNVVPPAAPAGLAVAIQ